MFERLMARVEVSARETVEATRRNVEAAFAALPDVQLRRDGDSIVIEAMGLARRWISDVRLRFGFWRPQ